MNTFLKSALRTGVPFGIFMGFYFAMQPGPPELGRGLPRAMQAA